MADAPAPGERLAELRRRWQEEPDSRVFLHLAEEYRRQGRPQEAVEVLAAGLEKHPNYVSAHVALGRCLLELGDADEALSTLEGAVDLDATNVVASRLLVEAHLQRDDPIRARRQLDAYSQLYPSDPQLEELRGRIQGLLLADVGEGHPGSGAPGGEGPALHGADGEPFPGLGGVAELRRLLAGLAAEGLFPLDLPGGGARPTPAPAPGAALPAAAAEPATATLGELYLRQGHLGEAERIFRQVLARSPGDRRAAAGLRAIAERAPRRLTAADLLAGYAGPEGEEERSAKRAYLLRSYLRRLGRGTDRDVP